MDSEEQKLSLDLELLMLFLNAIIFKFKMFKV
jgi:hypothetical protein